MHSIFSSKSSFVPIVVRQATKASELITTTYNEAAFTGFLTSHHDQIFREQKDLPKYENQICMSYDVVIKILDNYYIPRYPKFTGEW